MLSNTALSSQTSASGHTLLGWLVVGMGHYMAIHVARNQREARNKEDKARNQFLLQLADHWGCLHQTLAAGDDHSLQSGQTNTTVELDKFVSVLVQESFADVLSTVLEKIRKVCIARILYFTHICAGLNYVLCGRFWAMRIPPWLLKLLTVGNVWVS